MGGERGSQGRGVGESSPSAPEEQSLRSSSAPEKWEEEDRVPLSWRCHHPVAVPKGVAPPVPALGGAGLLGRAASPRLLGKGKEKAKGKGKGLRHPSPALQDGVLSLLPISREQGSNSIWIWRPLAGAKAVRRQPGAGSVRATLIPPPAPGPSPVPVALQTSTETFVWALSAPQAAQQGSHGQGTVSVFHPAFPKKGRRG